jgi:predicted transcriptional regulator of viral defense system
VTIQDLLRLARKESVIESRSLRALGEDPRTLGVQLSRWVAAGKLVQLRRGLYVLAPELRVREAPPFFLANILATPSYVSLESALAFHGLIPERVPLVQSVTTGRPTHRQTSLGAFQFRHVKRDWFFGYRETSVAGGTALVAEPEKALLDLIHLSKGPFPRARIEGLRLASSHLLNSDRLERYAQRGRPGVRAAAREVLAWMADERSTETAL